MVWFFVMIKSFISAFFARVCCSSKTTLSLLQFYTRCFGFCKAWICHCHDATMKVQFSFLPGKNSSILELKGKGGNKLLSSRISTNFLQQVSQIASLYQTLKKKNFHLLSQNKAAKIVKTCKWFPRKIWQPELIEVWNVWSVENTFLSASFVLLSFVTQQAMQ